MSQHSLTLEELKWDFYRWVGSLSIQECVLNEKLIASIAQLEQLFLRGENPTPQVQALLREA